MDTRQNIQPLDQPAVLSLAFSATKNRFTAGLTDGLRVFRTDNCLSTYSPPLPSARGVAIAESLDDRYLAYVGGGKIPTGKPTVVVFWDCLLECEVCKHDFHEKVLGVRLNKRWMVVMLRERAIVFAYQEIRPPTLPSAPSDGEDRDDSEARHPRQATLKGPNEVCAIYLTVQNEHAIGDLQGHLFAVPAQAIGQIQLISLDRSAATTGSKRVMRAHNSMIRTLKLSDDGTLLATASQQGTLIRVFNTQSLDLIGEYRRGVDHAITYSLAFSAGNRWLASTSDKGTVHIFDLQHSDPIDAVALRETQRQQRKTAGPPQISHRLSGNSYTNAPPESLVSGTSAGRSSPASATVQEYYGLRPPPAPASVSGHPGATSVMTAMRSSPLAPRIWKDIRGVASASFHIGHEPPHWQGAVAGKGKGYVRTTTPSGKSATVKMPVLPLPNDPSGRPPKGIISFVPLAKADPKVPTITSAEELDNDGASLFIIGGGSDPQWEMFDLLPRSDGGWVLQRRVVILGGHFGTGCTTILTISTMNEAALHCVDIDESHDMIQLSSSHTEAKDHRSLFVFSQYTESPPYARYSSGSGGDLIDEGLEMFRCRQDLKSVASCLGPRSSMVCNPRKRVLVSHWASRGSSSGLDMLCYAIERLKTSPWAERLFNVLLYAVGSPHDEQKASGMLKVICCPLIRPNTFKPRCEVRQSPGKLRAGRQSPCSFPPPRPGLCTVSTAARSTTIDAPASHPSCSAVRPEICSVPTPDVEIPDLGVILAGSVESGFPRRHPHEGGAGENEEDDGDDQANENGGGAESVAARTGASCYESIELRFLARGPNNTSTISHCIAVPHRRKLFFLCRADALRRNNHESAAKPETLKEEGMCEDLVHVSSPMNVKTSPRVCLVAHPLASLFCINRLLKTGRDLPYCLPLEVLLIPPNPATGEHTPPQSHSAFHQSRDAQVHPAAIPDLRRMLHRHRSK
nr:svp1-like protein 2 [Quercus suber]